MFGVRSPAPPRGSSVGQCRPSSASLAVPITPFLSASVSPSFKCSVTGAVTGGGYCVGVTRTFEPQLAWEVQDMGSACPGGSGQVTCGLALTGVAGKVTGKDPERHRGSREGRCELVQSAGWAAKLRLACCGGSSHSRVLVSLQGACRRPPALHPCGHLCWSAFSQRSRTSRFCTKRWCCEVGRARLACRGQAAALCRRPWQ